MGSGTKARTEPYRYAIDSRSLDAALDRLSLVAAETAATARAELAVSLEPLRNSTPDQRAWSASRLTARGFPVELAVTSASAELRTVVEVVPPEADRRQAFPTALRLAERFGSDSWCRKTERLLEEHQAEFAPRFGAWLGSRHHNHATRHKVYVEVSPDQQRVWALIDHLAPEARHVIGGIGSVRFIGLRLDRPQAVELYLRPPRLRAEQFRVCLVRAGLTERAEATLEAMAIDSGRSQPIDGLSLSADQNEIKAIAGFTFAHRRHGSDGCVRRAVSARAADERWASADIYAALVEPIPEQLPMPSNRPLRPREPPFHTVLSEVAAVGSASIEHHVGLAPPPQIRQTNQPLGTQP